MLDFPRRDFLRQSLSAITAISAAGAMHPLHARGEMPRRPIKVGQIGTAIGSHAPATMQTLRRLSDDFEVVGLVVEPDGGVDANHRAFDGIPRLTEGQLLDTPGLELVFVEGAIDELFPIAARVVAAGKHVHIEKPGSKDHAALVRLLADADRQDLMVQVAYWLRNLPALEFLFRALDEGWLGEIYEIDGVMSKVLNPAMRTEFAADSREPMFELGCYLVDSVVRIMGQPDNVTAFRLATRLPQDDYIDNQVAVLEYPKCLATLRATFVDINGFDRRQLSVCGSKGQIEIRPLEHGTKIKLTLSSPHDTYAKGTQIITPDVPRDRFEPYFRHLANTIRGAAPRLAHDHHRLVHKTLLEASGMSVTSDASQRG